MRDELTILGVAAAASWHRSECAHEQIPVGQVVKGRVNGEI